MLSCSYKAKLLSLVFDRVQLHENLEKIIIDEELIHILLTISSKIQNSVAPLLVSIYCSFV